ncbi:MAG: vWA domain-containing protein [Ignavibacteria bacterium]
MGTANAVTVIDASYSMTSNGYVDITKRDSSAFVSYARPGDGIGVVTFKDNGSINYPTSGTQLAIVNSNLDQCREAASAINDVAFNGNCTNMGGGISSARTLLDSASTPKAMVLLSDGYQNCGTSPLDVLPSYPVYSCAMGDNADKNLLKTIADRTGGKFYVAPYPSTMMLIFNDIRAQPSYVQSVQNTLNLVASQQFKLIPAVISKDNSESQFGVVWDDNSVRYTNTPNPGNNEISVTLVQPDGSLIKDPVIVGGGYVVYDTPAPVSGQWYIQVICGNNPQTLGTTSGAFEFPADSASAINFDISAPDKIKAGNKLSFTAQVKDKGQPVENLQMHARIEKPMLSSAEAIKKHSKELSNFAADSIDIDEKTSMDHAKLNKYRNSLLPKKDILGPIQYPVHLKEISKSNAVHEGKVVDTKTPGNYNIHVHVSGYSPISKTNFQRNGIVSVEVE